MSATAPKTALVPPLGSDAVWASGWTPAEARLAVDQFKRGTFRWAWQLGIDCTSYPPIKAALDQRAAVPDALPWTVDGPGRAPGRFETEAARLLWALWLRRLVRSTLRELALFGLSVWHHPLVVDPETLRTTVAPFVQGQQLDPAAGVTGAAWGIPYGGVERWPLSAVGWTAYPLLGVVGYYAIALGGQRIQLPRPGETRGDWTVIGVGDMPHLDGAICALDMPYTAGMLALRARSNLGVSAGRASPLYDLPEKVPVRTTDGDGKPVQGIGEDAADTLAALGTEQTAGIFPHGGTHGKFELTTTGAAEYFHTDALDSILMVELAILGRGGTVAKPDAQYQAQRGVEADVPEALNRRDVGAIERGASGLFNMLGQMNAGPDLAPITLAGHLPDADQAARRKAEQDEQKAEAEKLVKFHAAVHAERDNGFVFTGLDGQARLNAIAARCGVTAPTLPPEGLPPPLVRLPPPTTQIDALPDVPEKRSPPPPGSPLPAGTSAPAPASASPP